MLTYEYLKDNFYYDMGHLWRIDGDDEVYVGTVSEHNDKLYLRCTIHNRNYYVHRLIFWLEKGYLPKLVDHKDQDTLNNRIENLRDLSHSLNLLNAKIKTTNTSGVTGVRWNKNAEKWIARITYQGKEYHLGCFDTIEEATLARRNKETSLFKEC